MPDVNIKCAPGTQWTPSFQWISSASIAPARGSVGVFGLRLRLTL